MASLVLATLVAQVKGVQFYDLRDSGAGRGELVVLQRQPNNLFNANCLDVRLVHGRLLLGHIEAPVVARLSSLMRDVAVEVTGFHGGKYQLQAYISMTKQRFLSSSIDVASKRVIFELNASSDNGSEVKENHLPSQARVTNCRF